MRRTLLTVLALMALSPLTGHAASVTVKSGETLSDIAARYGVSVNSLMRLNRLSDANHIESGQTLRLPGSVTAGRGRHNVTSGDTLSDIAVRYRVSERQLMALNGLSSPDHVEIGQTLRLPSNAVLPEAKPKASAASTPVPIQATPNALSHTVARGQTLTQIAKAYNIPMASLISINAIENPNQVKIGTQLMLRSTETQTESTTALVAEPAEQQPAVSPSQTQVKPTAQSQPEASKPVEAAPVVTAKATETPETSVEVKPASWRTYGPLQVDWSNWQSMGGSDVAPTLNSEGQSLYVAVNCSAQKINATGANGMWKSWIAPQTEFERALVKDRCTTAKS